MNDLKITSDLKPILTKLNADLLQVRDEHRQMKVEHRQFEEKKDQELFALRSDVGRLNGQFEEFSNQVKGLQHHNTVLTLAWFDQHIKPSILPSTTWQEVCNLLDPFLTEYTKNHFQPDTTLWAALHTMALQQCSPNVDTPPPSVASLLAQAGAFDSTDPVNNALVSAVFGVIDKAPLSSVGVPFGANDNAPTSVNSCLQEISPDLVPPEPSSSQLSTQSEPIPETQNKHKKRKAETKKKAKTN